MVRLLVLALVAAPLAFPWSLAADSNKPNFNGTWQLDPAKSHVDDGRVISLTVEDAADGIKVVQVVHPRDGKDVVSKFTCPANGSECAFDEGGFKAKVSVWYNGSVLDVLKTAGPKDDEVMQWEMQVDAATSTLTFGVQHIEPAGQTETLVFTKAANTSQAARK